MTESDLDAAENGSDYDDEEIEILEIVGLDEDSPAGRSHDSATERDAEMIVVLDEEASSSAAEGDRAEVEEAERLARLSADFENLKKRVDRERIAHERHAAAQLVRRLLPVLDNFERALGAAREVGTDPGFCDGVAMIFRQLLEELRKEGLVAVDTVGETFDPEVHEAVATTDDCNLPPNTVVEELQRGYLLQDRLLRPALVKVTVDPREERPPAEDF